MSKKKKRNGKAPDSSQILRLLERSRRPVSLKHLLRSLPSRKPQAQALNNTLHLLEKKGTIVSLNQGQSFVLSRKLRHLSGKLELTSTGAGFVLPDDPGQKDIFISQSNLHGAWPGDRVKVALLPRTKGKNPEGTVLQVLDRELTQVLVFLTQKIGPGAFKAQAVEKSLRLVFEVNTALLRREPDLGDVLSVEHLEQISPGLFRAQAQEDLGPETRLSVQERIVKISRHIPQHFPASALKAAAELPDNPLPEEMAERRDLTHLPFVTIDGKEARDFDDAICVVQEGSQFLLLVAIADVSHYVAWGSPLDQEAEQRGNSFYFPCSVEPMFPENISAGLCSLLPDTPRLVMAAEMRFNQSGQRLKAHFYPAVIRSRGRLTYEQIKKGFLDKTEPEASHLKRHRPMLERAQELALQLKSLRTRRGSLDFDLPEAEFIFNSESSPQEVQAREHHFGHQIIEEFMLAANEAVAGFFTHNNLPCLYRIHPAPDTQKISELLGLLSSAHGLSLSEPFTNKKLQGLLQSAAGTHQEFLVNRLLLRTMMQAAYHTDNQGHFGLASEQYCHFTSPIRRYADLTVHRLLKAALGQGQKRSGLQKKLFKTAEHLNNQERKGVAAEREINKRLMILLLQETLGQHFPGIIASVTEDGLWVEFKQGLAEGFVRLSTSRLDSFELIPEEHRLRGARTGLSYQIGDQVQVQVINCSLSRLEIDLEIVS